LQLNPSGTKAANQTHLQSNPDGTKAVNQTQSTSQTPNIEIFSRDEK
jgi:hypothetical protein